MRKRISALLHRWAYRIEGHRAEHRTGDQILVSARNLLSTQVVVDRFRRGEPVEWGDLGERKQSVFAASMDEAERLESRGWTS